MTDVSFSVLAGADDGRAKTDTSSFNNSNNSALFGQQLSSVWRTFIRFDNVTIPNGAIIDSAVVRMIAAVSDSGITCNANVYFEDADDPTAPSDGSDLDSRGLGSAVAWSAISAWTAGNTYDTPDLTEELKAITDRVGWASGQAITCHIVDNGSSNNAERFLATYEHISYTEPQLVVSYHLPNEIGVSESITISEDISFESDLFKHENLELTEFTDLLLGFDESLPTITEDITLTESVTMIRGLSGLPIQSESIELTESVAALLGFDESLPEQTENINLSEYSLVDISPNISVFELITLEETGNIRPEPFALDQIDLSEYVLTRRGYWADVEDTITVTDDFSVFHYSNWLRQNAAKSKQRFFFTLTGATDSTTDIELPASSIFARKRSGDPTYLQVTIPSFNYSTEIALRPSGEMLVDMGYEIDGAIELRERILEADLEDIATYEGPLNRSIVLTGHRTQSLGGQLVTFQSEKVIYRGYQTRARAFRFAFIDPFLNPGDTVVVGLESFTCNNIIYTIQPTRTVMEVREAL